MQKESTFTINCSNTEYSQQQSAVYLTIKNKIWFFETGKFFEECIRKKKEARDPQ